MLCAASNQLCFCLKQGFSGLLVIFLGWEFISVPCKGIKSHNFVCFNESITHYFSWVRFSGDNLLSVDQSGPSPIACWDIHLIETKAELVPGAGEKVLT